MHYRSIADMNAAVLGGLHRLPGDLDLVVGIPRSGLLAANLISLTANIPMTDLDGFVAGRTLSSGATKKSRAMRRSANTARKVLVVDDSMNTGSAMRDARAKLATSGTAAQLIFAAIYGNASNQRGADLIFEVVPQPRIFQWNFMHHSILGQSCVDIDGVLCPDPSPKQNDDGPGYERFLLEATPLYRPTQKIAYLVTSRLERYRPLTEDWLARHEIEYGTLIMLDLPSRKERQNLSAHHKLKADFYRNSTAILFIESEQSQAAAIARGTGKPVLCLETQQIVKSRSTEWSPKRSAVEHPGPAPRAQNGAFGPAPNGTFYGDDDDSLDIALVLIDSNDRSKPRTLISYLGSTAENAAEVIESVRQVCVARSEFPIVVISEFGQELFTSCKCPLEFIPAAKNMPSLAPDEYTRYVNRRWALLLEKWKIEREVTLASSLDEFVAKQTLDLEIRPERLLR